MKLKFEYIKEDNHKHMRSSRQNDKLDKRVKHRNVKDKILGSIPGRNKQKVFFNH